MHRYDAMIVPMNLFAQIKSHINCDRIAINDPGDLPDIKLAVVLLVVDPSFDIAFLSRLPPQLASFTIAPS